MLRNIIHKNLIINIFKKNIVNLNEDKLGFGKIFTNHLLEIDWNFKSGWNNPKIKPYQKIKFNPASSVFHYGFSAFEGMKAYRDDNNSIRLFRPDENMKRFQRSARELCFPEFDSNELLKCIESLIKLDSSWVPTKFGNSLYIRPFIISTDNDLSVVAPNSCKIMTILSPVGKYYKNDLNDITLFSDEKFTRAWPGGTGDLKIGGNYAPTLRIQNKAIKKNHSQVLWLNNGKISEVGTMNIFFLKNIKNNYELITPRLDGTILPGITRDAVIKIIRCKYSNVKIIEKDYYMNELINDINNGNINEIFGTGTAAIISPISSFEYYGNIYSSNYKVGELTNNLYNTLMNIQYGKIIDTFNWSKII